LEQTKTWAKYVLTWPNDGRFTEARIGGGELYCIIGESGRAYSKSKAIVPKLKYGLISMYCKWIKQKRGQNRCSPGQMTVI